MPFPPTAFSPCRIGTFCRSSVPVGVGNRVMLAPPPFSFLGCSSSTSLAAAIDMQTVGGSMSQPVVFEPVLNGPALAAFLAITIIVTLLQFRINAIGAAVTRRKTALEELRALKSMELSSDGKERPTADLLSKATIEYETALREEENIRTIMPGVRLVAPNAADGNAQDVAAAKQFLGLDLQPGGDQSSQTTEKEDDGLSAGSIAVLAIVALSQLALLFMLSSDPMITSNGFTSMDAGDPPADIPLSSWSDIDMLE